MITLSGGAGVETGTYFNGLARVAGVPGPISAPTPVALLAARVAAKIASLRRTQLEFGPEGVAFLAARTGTYGIGTAREVLGWTPRIGLDEGLDRTGQWLREHQRLFQ